MAKNLRVWVSFYALGTFIALLLQNVLVPKFATEWRPGTGLLASPGDWVRYHLNSLELVPQIRSHLIPDFGKLLAEKRFIAVNAFFYAWLGGGIASLIPLMSLLYATSCFSIYAVSRRLLRSDTSALIPALVFALCPTTVFLFSQPLKDPYFICGFLGLMSLVHASIDAKNEKPWLNLSFDLIASVTALALIWLSRSYVMEVILWSLVPAVLLSWMFPGQRPRTRTLVFLAALTAFLSLGSKLSHETANPGDGLPAPARTTPLTVAQRGGAKGLKSTRNQGGPDGDGDTNDDCWRPGPGWPTRVDEKLRAIGSARRGFLITEPNAPTALDVTRTLCSGAQIIEYIPRAAQIGLFSPFPSQWSGKGSTERGAVTRHIAAREMIFIYICFIGLIFVTQLEGFGIGLIVTSVTCVSLLLLNSIVVNNIGTLYRLRYAFIMFIVSVGICGWIRFFGRQKRRLSA